MKGERCRSMRPLHCIARDGTSVNKRERQRDRTGERQKDRKTVRENVKTLHRRHVTNPQGAGGRSVQDQSAAPQQGRTPSIPTHHS